MAQQIEDSIPNEVFTNVSLQNSNPDLSKSDPMTETENYVEQVTEITQTKDNKKSNSLKRFFHRKTGKVCSSESLADDSSVNPTQDDDCPKRDSLSKRFRNMKVGSYFSARQEKEKQPMEASATQQEKTGQSSQKSQTYHGLRTYLSHLASVFSFSRKENISPDIKSSKDVQDDDDDIYDHENENEIEIEGPVVVASNQN